MRLLETSVINDEAKHSLAFLSGQPVVFKASLPLLVES